MEAAKRRIVSAFGEAEILLREGRYQEAWQVMDKLPGESQGSTTTLDIRIRAAAGMRDLGLLLTLARDLASRGEEGRALALETLNTAAAGFASEGRTTEAEAIQNLISQWPSDPEALEGPELVTFDGGIPARAVPPQ
jgi:hypothetical protein